MIGGTGFVSSFILSELRRAGHEIVVFHRGTRGVSVPDGVREVRGNRRSLPDYAEKLRKLHTDVVIDTIALWEQDAQQVVNVFKGFAGRTVLISSQDVYRAYGILTGLENGMPEPVPVKEDAALRTRLYPYRGDQSHDAADPDRYFYYDKILCERVYMSESELPGTVLRLPMVYGPGDRQRRTLSYLRRMDAGRKYIVMSQQFAEWRWTRGYVEDVAHGVALAVKDSRAAGRIYNLGERNVAPMRDWVKSIGIAAGWDGEIVEVPDEQLPAALRAGIDTRQPLVADTARVREEFGYEEIVSPDAALCRTIAWERGNPPAGCAPADYAAENEVLRSIGLTSGL